MNVFEAFSKVMGDVQGIRKGERNNQQGFNFRGIDTVLNAVGPVLRKYGVIIVPEAVSVEVERYQTAKGAVMQGVIALMRYTVIGPEGDSFTGSAYGQASDSGDKAVTKAESVAYRTFLLQALTVPTDEPDPDAFSHDRVPQVDESAVLSWVAAMEGAADLNDLQSAWNAAGKAGVTRDARVVAAKDKRKGELSVAENAG